MTEPAGDVPAEPAAPQWPNRKDDYELLDVIGQSVSGPVCPVLQVHVPPLKFMMVTLRWVGGRSISHRPYGYT